MAFLNGLTYYWKLIVILISATAAKTSAFPDSANDERLAKISACKNVTLQRLCQVKCGDYHSCLLGKCFCLLPTTDTNAKEQLSPEFSQTPMLRHHIAHFCPNLEEARKCIKRCMKHGKPAFCGKDHVCYCGHKSYKLGDEEEIDTASIYGQFKDMYAKYFGI